VNVRERTLGILSFVTSRSDFTPSMRDRLVKWVAMHYRHDSDSAQQEKELRTLLKDFDSDRIKTLRDRFKRMRRMQPGRYPSRGSRLFRRGGQSAAGSPP
jgi:hypothetical protein